VPFDHVLVMVTTDGETDGPSEVPFGANTLETSGGSYHFAFSVPDGYPGYTIVPAEVDATLECGETVPINVQVQQDDATPPVISSVTPSTAVLWPANHKMVGVNVQVQATDNGGAPVCSIQSVASSEPIAGLGDGDTAPDWSITGPLQVDLRAERAGKNGPGRTYTITVSCSDSAGNASTSSTEVKVPYSQGKK
jgi:hypothetical protein